MQYYQIKDITKTIGARTLYHIKQIGFHQKDRIGLIGANGVGKTTLIKQLSDAQHSPIVPSATKHLLPQIKPSAQYSGGEIVQQYLDQAFASHADILFLDEPTANLDEDNIQALESRLSHYPGTLILISHDRAFLDHIATTIWSLEDQTIRVTKGNYSAYKQQATLRQHQQRNAYDQYTKKKMQLERAAEKRAQKASRAAVIPQNKVNSQEAYKAKPYFHKKEAKLAKTAKSIERRATQLDEVARPQVQKPIKMTLNHGAELRKNKILTLDHYDLRQGDKLLAGDIQVSLKGKDKVALTGPNGSGKTTLIEAILAGKSQRIHISDAARIGYFQQDLHNLDTHKTVYQNVATTAYQDETTMRTVLARLGFGADQLQQPVGVLSGGERVKVSFAKIFVSDANFLILDEPTNFLDIVALEALQQLLVDYKGGVLLVSHDRYFKAKVAQKQWVLDPKTRTLKDPAVDRLGQQPVKPTVVDHSELKLKLKNRQSYLLNALTEDPDNQAFAQEFQAVSRQLRELD